MIDRTRQPKVVATHRGATYRVDNQLVTFKALAADTNGVYSLFEMHTAPGQGAQRYCQRYEDETFWVLNGHYTFLLGSQELTLSPGDYVYVPRGTVHGYTNHGSGPAHMLILVTPGGIRERFLVEVGNHIGDQDVVQMDDPTRLPALLRSAARYGIEILPANASLTNDG